jgi:hypothetical protein
VSLKIAVFRFKFMIEDKGKVVPVHATKAYGNVNV